MTADDGPTFDAEASPASRPQDGPRLEGDAAARARAPADRSARRRKIPPRTAMAQRQAHRADRAERSSSMQKAGHARPAAAAQQPAGPRADAGHGDIDAPRSLADDAVRLACILIPSFTAGVDTEAFRSELLQQLRLARPDADDRSLAIALVEIRRQLLAFAPAPSGA